MRSKAARTTSLIIGGLAVLVGGVWIGQGSGLIKGSFMTGSRTWLAIGLLCFVVGLLTDLPCVAASCERQRLTCRH